MNPEATIAALLAKAVVEAVDGTMPIQFPMQTFVVPNDQKYIELIQIRNNIDAETWNEEKTYRGTLRLILHWPIDSSGEIAALRVAESILSSMKKGSRYKDGQVSVTIYDNPDVSSSIPNGTEALIPMSLPYTYFYFD